MIQDHQLQELCTRREPMLVLGSLPDTFQWKRVLMISCKDTDTARSILKLTLPTGAVFTGPAGNGRHTTAEALAGSLYNKGRNYAQVLCLHGEDLDFEDPADLGSVLKHVATLTQRGDMVLILDRPDLSRHNLTMQRRLLRLQDVLAQQDIRLFLILITGTDQDLDPEVSSRHPIYHCPCPDEETVRDWVATILKNPVTIKISRMNADSLTERLTGLSWKQLQDFHSHLKRLLVYKWSKFLKNQHTEEYVYTSGTVTFSYEDVAPMLASLGALRPKPEFTPAMYAPFPMNQANYMPDSSAQTTKSSTSDKTSTTDEQIEAGPGGLSAEEISALFNP